MAHFVARYHNPWHEPVTLLFVTLLISTIILNALALSSIVWRVKQNGRQLPEIERDEDQYVKKCTSIDEAQQDSKVVIKQSLAYIGAFILTLLFPILRMLLWNVAGDHYHDVMEERCRIFVGSVELLANFLETDFPPLIFEKIRN